MKWRLLQTFFDSEWPLLGIPTAVRETALDNLDDEFDKGKPRRIEILRCRAIDLLKWLFFIDSDPIRISLPAAMAKVAVCTTAMMYALLCESERV